MKPKDASKLGHEIKTPHDLLKDSSDAVNSSLSLGAPSSIPSNLQLPPKKSGGKLGTTTSVVWDHFTKLPCVVGDVPYCCCNYCGKNLKCPTRSGTSVLHNHLKRCPKYPFNKVDETQQNLCFKSEEDGQKSSGSVIWKFDQALCRKYCAKMVIMDELPFRIVEHEGFRDFCNMMQPRFQVPSRFTVTKDCMEIYLEEKKKLFKYFQDFKQRVCLTTDIWTSRQNLSYLCLTVHFIDSEWKLHKRILGFTPIPSHSGDVIGKCIEKHLLEWGIDKVLTITVDNASSNDIAIKYMKKRLNNWKQSIQGSDYLHMRCCAHILNLIVKEGLKDLDDSIFRIRSAVRYVRSSPARMQRFKLCVEQEKIESKGLVCLDVETRWNSTFLMLDVALKFETAFDRLGEQDFKYRDELRSAKMKGLPSDLDWEHARALLPFLRAFYDATLKLSGSSYVTSNYYFHVVFGIGMMINDKLNDPNSTIKLMAANMREKYHKYWGNVKNLNPLLFISMILDPRHKMDYVIFVIEEVYDEKKSDELSVLVKQTLNELFDHYSLSSGISKDESNVSSQSNLPKVESDELDLFAYSKSKYKRKRAESVFSEGKTELEKYLEDKVEPDVDKFDVLAWWKNKSKTYPIISLMARDILAIPVSTVASESAFSTGGRVLDPFRSSLTPKIVECLICAQNWLRSSPVPIQKEEEIEEMEDIESGFEDLRLNETTMTIDD